MTAGVRRKRQQAQRVCSSLALGLVLAVATASPAWAQAPGAATDGKSQAAAKSRDDAHRREDIARHRQMARAHEDAARCLEAGEKESVCQERLREACKGIAVGRYCGMRHAH
jgi:hypothetical protein